MQQAPNVLTCFIQNVAWKISGSQVFFWHMGFIDKGCIRCMEANGRSSEVFLCACTDSSRTTAWEDTWLMRQGMQHILFLDKVVWIKIGNKNPAIALVVNLMMVKRNKSASREYSIPQSHWNGKTYLETTIMFTIASTTHSSCNFTINVKITFAD